MMWGSSDVNNEGRQAHTGTSLGLRSFPTYLVSDCKRSMKAVVLDDGTASFWRADGADIRHAQGVTGVVATEVLDQRNTVRPNSHALETDEKITYF